MSYQQLGNHLVRLGELAHTFRQFDRVRETGLILSNWPVKSYQAIGHYFLAVAANSKGNGDQDEAKRLFELAIDTAPDDYKVKAILSLGALAFHKRDFDFALYFYKETIKAGKLSAASMQAIKTINVVKAIEGSHAQAVKGLEDTLPLIKYAPPHIYFDVLNSYAVELGEVGRINEAENVSRLTIASPFASYYPEWLSTYFEIRSTRKRRSTIRVSLPQGESAEDEEEDFQPVENNLIPFPIARSLDALENMPISEERLGSTVTHLQLLGVMLRVKLKDRITDAEIIQICTTYYNAVMNIWKDE